MISLLSFLFAQEECLETECGQMLEAGYPCEELIYYFGLDCSACEEECGGHNDECEEGYVIDCSGDGDCCTESWIGDGFPDCEEQEYGCDLTCYDNDGGDCDTSECPEGEVASCSEPFQCVYTDYIGDGFCQDGSNPQYNFDLSCYDNDGGDCQELDLTLILISPQGGDYIPNYTAVDVRWEYEGSDSTGITLSFNCSYYLGGGLVEIANGIDLLDDSAILDLSTDMNGEPIDAETIFGNFKIVATDATGVSTNAVSSGEFIIGDPEGEINANFLSEDQASVVLDWAWMEDQTIVLTREGILGVQNQGFEFIKIYDQNGIHTETCDDQTTTAPVTLRVLDIRPGAMEEIETQFLTLPCGFDYCYEDGARLLGYLPQNQIHFSTGFFGEAEYEMIPTSAQLIDGPMLFDNDTYIIDTFTVGLLIDGQTVSFIDNREWDRFNVYGKVTNHQGSSTRECNDNGVCDVDESLVDCFDDCCLVPGDGENEEWCLVETVDGISNFEDNLASGNYLPAETSSATLNYRVWLLDNDDIEVVKTIDTEINYQADNLFCEGDGDVNGDGNVNVVDIISLVGHILETTPITDPILLCEADLNQDGLYNISDIVMLVNIILN